MKDRTSDTAPPPGNMLRVLVVDDEDIVRSAFQLLLEAYAGVLVESFKSPTDALARFARTDAPRFGAALLDQRMPEMSGLDLACALRAIDPALPIAFVTGTPEMLFEQTPTKLGAFTVFRKPFEVEKILAFLEEVRAAQ